MTVKAFSRAAAIPTHRFAGGRRGPGARSRSAASFILVLACLAMLATVAGCGDTPDTRPEEVLVVEKALQAALGGERVNFAGLVAPSFLAQVRTEIPDSDDETLGGILIAGFVEEIPFAGIVAAEYDVETAGERASVYVWGSFLDGAGAEIRISEAEALRIPLVREDGRWYLDLLDL